RGRVLDRDGAPVAGAVVRVGRHPRANFELPGGRALAHVHPCAVVHTDAAGAFHLADLPPGTLQVLVRAPRHRTALAPVVLTAGAERHVALHLLPGVD